MNTETFKADIRKLLAHTALDEKRIASAEKAAYLTMAHHLDLPDAQNEGTVTVTANTAGYEPALDNNRDIDRITSAVFVSSSGAKSKLNEMGIRQYQFLYRGEAQTGIPEAWCWHNDKIWLYYIPSVGGTVYFTCQEVPIGLTDFPDNYYPLMIALVKQYIYQDGGSEHMALYYAARREVKELLKSFKGRVRPKKETMEMTPYRAQRVKELNSLI